MKKEAPRVYTKEAREPAKAGPETFFSKMFTKGMIVLLLLGVLLASPLVLAQEQVQTYSGFDRFVDNVKMFFSYGDKKVMLASEIREKEVNSAIVNTKNGDDKEAEKNLERAWKRLQFIQEKVSFDTAEEMKEDSEGVRTRIVQEGNLSNDFEVYVLEEEKTGLTAEWVAEVDGERGTLEREVVTDGVEGRTVEIEKRIDELDNEIKEWVVDNFVAKDGEGDGGLTWEVATKIVEGDSDDGLTREIKTYVEGDGTLKNDVVEDGNGGMAPGMVADEDFVPGRGVVGGDAAGTSTWIDEGPCTEGEADCDSGTVDTDASDDTVNPSDE